MERIEKETRVMDMLKVIFMMIGCCIAVGLAMQFPHGGVLLLCIGLLFSVYDSMKPDTTDSSYI